MAIDPNFKDALNIKGAILDSLGNATKFQKYAYGIKMQYPSDWILSDFISSPQPIQSKTLHHSLHKETIQAKS